MTHGNSILTNLKKLNYHESFFYNIMYRKVFTRNVLSQLKNRNVYFTHAKCVKGEVL